MPGASTLISTSPLRRIVTDLKKGVGLVIAVAPLAGPHSVIPSPVKDRRDRLHGEIGRNHRRIGGMRVHDPVQSVRYMPDRATRHHHMPRGRADPPDPRSHVVSSIKDHALGCQGIEVWSLQNRIRIVYLQVKRRLIISNDEQDVGPLCRYGAWKKKKVSYQHEEEAQRTGNS